ncbi:unnamed protein product, partial [Adineta steineri]
MIPQQRTTRNKVDLFLSWYCNHGIYVHRSDKRFKCFCPPSFYGDRCQYQNQFIGLILYVQRKSLRDHASIFRIVVVLLDTRKNILFQEQIVYIRHCKRRYETYLLYPDRPELKSLNYSVRLDVYAIHRLDNTIQFRTTLYYRILYPFLPVNRIVAELIIPEKADQASPCHNIQCQNGQCYQYANSAEFYCRCHSGWSGEFCHIPHTCQCSPQSLCVETGCICPLGKSGTFCYIPEAIACKNNLCKNGGTCIPYDQKLLKQELRCLCPDEYEGDTCEKKRMHLVVSFKKVTVPQSILIHLITTRTNADPDHAIQFKRISLYQSTVVVYPTGQYDIAYAQFDHTFGKKKSKAAAKLMVSIIVFVCIAGVVHDPINRRLLQDTEENRIWCV